MKTAVYGIFIYINELLRSINAEHCFFFSSMVSKESWIVKQVQGGGTDGQSDLLFKTSDLLFKTKIEPPRKKRTKNHADTEIL